jgi:hypothetical protein
MFVYQRRSNVGEANRGKIVQKFLLIDACSFYFLPSILSDLKCFVFKTLNRKFGELQL